MDFIFKKNSAVRRFITCLTIACIFPVVAHADLWRTGYYPGWEQSYMPASKIDFTALTHVIHFSVVPNANGTLNSSANSVTVANSSDIVSKAHAAGVKVIICVGGSESQTAFQAATTPAILPTFISNITNFVATRGYDGVDLDWEPFPSTDAQQYTNLVIGLRTALNGLAQPKLVTAAVGAYPPYGDSATAAYKMFASIQNQFDQINIMTYDLSGPYDGWVTWFNSPIYDGGYFIPGSSRLVPSVNGAVNNFVNNGMLAGKLGNWHRVLWLHLDRRSWHFAGQHHRTASIMDECADGDGFTLYRYHLQLLSNEFVSLGCDRPIGLSWHHQCESR